MDTRSTMGRRPVRLASIPLGPEWADPDYIRVPGLWPGMSLCDPIRCRPGAVSAGAPGKVYGQNNLRASHGLATGKGMGAQLCSTPEGSGS